MSRRPFLSVPRFIALAAAYLLLWLAIAWLVRPRGNRTDTYFHRTLGGRYYFVTLYPGKVSFQHSTRTFPGSKPATGLPPDAWGHETGTAGNWPAPKSVWNRLGFWYWPNSARIMQASNEAFLHQSWIVPKWFILLAPACPAAAWAAAWLWRRRRRRAGLCKTCGYDLRATPGRCPECGTPRSEGVA